MTPIDIYISNHVEVKLNGLPERKREKHIRKTEKTANRVLRAAESNKATLLVKTLGYNKKLLVRLLKDVLEGIAFTAIKIIPGALAILL